MDEDGEEVEGEEEVVVLVATKLTSTKSALSSVMLVMVTSS